MNKKWPYKTGGIPDDMFIRGKVPMTKAEVRVVTLAKTRIKEDSVIWDIGAGTGSISIEAAISAGCGKVYAVEKNEEALLLIRKNLEAFDLLHVSICPGEAPAVLEGLPQPDRVIVGGSGGNIREIIVKSFDSLSSGGRLVVNAATLETLAETTKTLKRLQAADLEITQVNISKTETIGRVHMLKANNPIFVISAEKI